MLLKKLVSEEEESSVRMTLLSHSWVEEEDGSDTGSAEIFGVIHRLMAEFLRSMSSDPTGELRAVVEALIDVLDPDACRDPGQWKELDTCQPHADHVFDRAMAQHSAESRKADLETTVHLGLRIANLRDAEGLAQLARRTEERAAELAKVQLGLEHHLTLAAMNNLAETLWMQGDLDGARKLLEETLTIRRRVLGAEHEDTLVSMSDLAATMAAQGDLDASRKLHEETLAVRRRVLGAEHPETLRALNNLAETMRNQGDLGGARRLHEVTLAIYRRVLGARHPDTLASMNNLAGVMGAQGDLNGACGLYRETLAICRELLGPEHPRTTRYAWNLFRTLEDMGDRAAAQEVLDHDLPWLLHRDPASLDALQRQVQGYLCDVPSRGFRIE